MWRSKASTWADQNFNLWQAENPFDVYLLIVVLVALVPPALTL